MLNNHYQGGHANPEIPVLRLISFAFFPVTVIKGKPLHVMLFFSTHNHFSNKKDTRYVQKYSGSGGCL